MTKKVLNVGQCSPDHSRMSQFLKSHFDVDVHAVETHDEAVQKAADSSWDLILLNRVYDATGTSGLDTLRTLKSTSGTDGLPVMLISNYADAQSEAVANGAEPGFGKAALSDPATLERVSRFLAE